MEPQEPTAALRVVWRQPAFARPTPAPATIDESATRAVLEAFAARLAGDGAPERADDLEMAQSRAPVKPTPGWKPRVARGGFVNPKHPAVPATLDLTLEEYYASSALMGILSAQGEEPDDDWVRDRSFQLGEKMAAEARRRRKR